MSGSIYWILTVSTDKLMLKNFNRLYYLFFVSNEQKNLYIKNSWQRINFDKLNKKNKIIIYTVIYLEK